MKRWRRWLFNFAAAVSLVLCIAWIAFWLSGMLPIDMRPNYWNFPHHQGAPFLFITPESHGLQFAWISPHQNPSAQKGSIDWGAGFRAYWYPLRLAYVESLIVPSWFAMSVLALLPLLWTWIRLRAKWRPCRGICRACGYDLRATPERCPECGTVPKDYDLKQPITQHALHRPS